jgi:hypothetical protein
MPEHEWLLIVLYCPNEAWGQQSFTADQWLDEFGGDHLAVLKYLLEDDLCANDRIHIHMGKHMFWGSTLMAQGWLHDLL